MHATVHMRIFQPGEFERYWCEADAGRLVFRDEEGEADDHMLEMDLNGCVLSVLYEEPVRSAGFEARPGATNFWLELVPMGAAALVGHRRCAGDGGEGSSTQ